MSKLKLVIRDAGLGEPDDAGQHIYCGGCNWAVYDVAGCAAVQCLRCGHWNQIGPRHVRLAELFAAARTQAPAQSRATQRKAARR